jgi:hypothetical protein
VPVFVAVCGYNPVGVANVLTMFSQGSSSLTTLGFEAESLWDSPFVAIRRIETI